MEDLRRLETKKQTYFEVFDQSISLLLNVPFSFVTHFNVFLEHCCEGSAKKISFLVNTALEKYLHWWPV